MSRDPLTGFDFDEAAGTMELSARKAADDHLYVQFFLHPYPDILLTEGGELPKTHPRVKELRARELERLELLRRANPFDEPMPESTPAGAPESAAKMAAELRADWELRRKQHDDDIKSKAMILLDHPDNPKLYLVARQDRLVYTEREFIRIIKPGDRDSILEVPLDSDPDYKKRFAARYLQWRDGVQGAGAVGTPLREVPFLNSAQREEFAFFAVNTAEQLVNMNDGVAQHFMGIRELQRKVRAWLEATHGLVPAVEQMQAQLASKDAEMQAMRQAISDLQARLVSSGEVAPPTGDAAVAATVERIAAEARNKRDRLAR
jgi:hypothetical protein